jgi:DNA-binding beta-propeller fold protein YncE
MRRALWVLLLVLAGCNERYSLQIDLGSVAPPYTANCTVGEPSAEAKVPAGPRADGSVILPGGRAITPAGSVLPLGGFPLALRMLPSATAGAVERYVVVTDGDFGDEYLRLVDLQAPAGTDPVISKVGYIMTSMNASDPSLFYGMALTASGSKLYVSDGGYDGAPASESDAKKHFNVIESYSIAGSPPALQRLDSEEIHLYFSPSGSSAQPRYPAGLALSADEKTLFVATQLDGTLAVIDLASGLEIGRTPELGVAPYAVLVDDASKTAYVSLWGGLQTTLHMFSDGVVAVDISNLAAPMATGAPIATGKSPEAMVAHMGQAFVVDADGDDVTTIDLASRTTKSTPVAWDASGLRGSAPNDLAVDAAHDRLYVANAGEDAVQAFQLSTMKSLGRVPTAWYPTAVAVLSDGTLVIASAKGLGLGAVKREPDKNGMMQGVLQVVPFPSQSELMAGDQAAHANLARPRSYEVPLTCSGTPKAFPLPPERGPGDGTPPASSPIRYSFLIVRENKTYDAVLGDLASGNGDPSLAIFGGDLTPNLHALAQRFTNLDNFYSDADQSVQGHEWTTANMANDYIEKAWDTTAGWGRGTRPTGAVYGAEPLEHLTVSPADSIWNRLDRVGLVYHNYGEVVNTSTAMIQNDRDYPGYYFALKILDVDKINYVISNIQDSTFILEPFSYIGLPNDHTQGTTPGQPTPASMIADNDEATGRFIDALSHSPYWSQSIVFIIEDDPQDGGDHVEEHRSPCIVVSPWARAGYTSSVHYDVPSLWRTLTLLLDVPPINQRDDNAAAMYDVFSPTPTLDPYTFVPRKVAPQVNAADAPLADESARIDFTRPDQAPLGRILWKAMKGRAAEPPWTTTRFRRDDDD